MFSSKELIHFVFANENDTYYGEDLLKLQLNQQLWKMLHEIGYGAVYFLSAEAEKKVFRVRSFGDQCCNPYSPKKKLFGSKTEQKEQGKWLTDQLRAKSGSAAAFVCPLEDFCSVLEDDRWDEILESIVSEKKRTGVFVLTASATAERTSTMLLESPAFEKLRETAVTDLRGGVPLELYSTLKKRKWDSCLFLNEFTWERVRALLLHLAVEHPERCESCEKLDAMADYLHAYLNDPALADGEPLWQGQQSAEYLMFGELYQKLKNEGIWKKLVARSEQCQTRGSLRTHEGAVRIPILRDRNSYAGRCVNLKLPTWLCREEEQERAQMLLGSIRDGVSAPKNRMENGKLVQAAEDFLTRLDAVSPGDTETYCLILSALKFCVDWVYAEEADERTAQVLQLAKTYRQAVELSGNRFVIRRELQQFVLHQPAGNMGEKTIQQAAADLYAGDELQKKYTDLIAAKEWGLKASANAEKVADMVARLEREIADFEQQPAAEPAEIPAEQPQEPPQEEKQTYVLRPEDWNYIPN